MIIKIVFKVLYINNTKDFLTGIGKGIAELFIRMHYWSYKVKKTGKLVENISHLNALAINHLAKWVDGVITLFRL
jgi:hypothetical protein